MPKEVTHPFGQYGGSCVAYIKSLFPPDKRFQGNAINIQPNTFEPAVGRVVLTSESIYGHVALIEAIDGEYLILNESNYFGDETITYGRRLFIHSPKIRGYFDFAIID